jgi:hypothetical protein
LIFFRSTGYLYIPATDSKTEYKAIPLISEDVEILKSIASILRRVAGPEGK